MASDQQSSLNWLDEIELNIRDIQASFPYAHPPTQARALFALSSIASDLSSIYNDIFELPMEGRADPVRLNHLRRERSRYDEIAAIAKEIFNYASLLRQVLQSEGQDLELPYDIGRALRLLYKRTYSLEEQLSDAQSRHRYPDSTLIPPDEFSTAVYLDTDDQAQAEVVFSAAVGLVNELGYDHEWRDLTRPHSIFRTGWAKLQAGLSSKELHDRLIKAERAVELAQIEGRQAEVDNKQAEAFNKLVIALHDIPAGCIRSGSILLIKYQSPYGPVIVSRNLSQLEIRLLEKYPEIQMHPQRTLQALAEALASAIDNKDTPASLDI